MIEQVTLLCYCCCCGCYHACKPVLRLASSQIIHPGIPIHRPPLPLPLRLITTLPIATVAIAVAIRLRLTPPPQHIQRLVPLPELLLSPLCCSSIVVTRARLVRGQVGGRSGCGIGELDGGLALYERGCRAAGV